MEQTSGGVPFLIALHSEMFESSNNFKSFGDRNDLSVSSVGLSGTTSSSVAVASAGSA